MNNNLREIKLGAPPSIVLSKGCPNVELSVQFMGLCEELTLKDNGGKCTKDGAIKTAAKLLSSRFLIKDIITDLTDKNLSQDIVLPLILEYPNLIYSFTNGKRNWLKGDGAYIKTNFYPTSNSYAEADYINNKQDTGGNSNSNGFYFGSRIAYTNSMFEFGDNYNGNSTPWIAYGSNTLPNGEWGRAISQTSLHISISRELSKRCDGKEWRGMTGFSTSPSSYPLFLFAGNFSGTPNSFIYNGMMSLIELGNGGERSFLFVPFMLGKDRTAAESGDGLSHTAGECGMIDLVSGKFYGNANSTGSFTIVTE